MVLDRGRVIATGSPASLKADIGGQRLHVRPLHRADLALVTSLVAEVAPALRPTLDLGELVVPVD